MTLAIAGTIVAPAYAAAAKTSTLLAVPSANAIDQAPVDSIGRYSIEINGKDIDANSCIMVPLDKVAEELGFKVTWNDDSILVDNGSIHTNVRIGVDSYFITTSNKDLVGMSAPFSLGIAPFKTDKDIYVPLSLFDALLRHGDDTIIVNENKIIIQTKDTCQ